MLGIALLASFLAAAPVQDAPPGLVLVKGGQTKIGSTVDEVEKLALQREALKNVLAAQTPQFTLKVDDFYLMPTEVTNEQYAEYVKATGAKPPRSWGVQALQAGQAAFLQEQGKAKQEAKAAGQSFESKVFDPEAWWEANWKEAKWEIPDTERTNPVVFVKYADAQHYARWAGLRLMTEFEFQRAARGDTARTFPWGDDWDDKKYCHSLHIGKDLTSPAGSFPDGAVNGIFDLAGNVWEWTSSPFTEYPGYKQLRFQVKKRVLECLAPFDPNQRVTVSGSYQMDEVGVRVATRMNTDRSQSTSALGFRCAASKPSQLVMAGFDAAEWILVQDLNLSVLGKDATLDSKQASILRRWTSTPGTCKVPGYAVITSYEQVVVCPRSEIKANATGDLATQTKDGPIVLGVIQVPFPMAHPELDAGTYYILWRGAGKLSEETGKDEKDTAPDKQQGVKFNEVPGFTAEKDCYLFFSADGTPQVAIEAPPAKLEKSMPGGIKVEAYVPPTNLPKGTPAPTPADTLRFTLTMQTATSKAKGFIFDLPIQVKPGTYDASWK